MNVRTLEGVRHRPRPREASPRTRAWRR